MNENSTLERGAALFKKATFALDRGYDDNKIFLKFDALGQDYVIRLTSRRKLFFHGKWLPTTQLRSQRNLPVPDSNYLLIRQ